MKGIEQFRRQLEALDKKVRNRILSKTLRDGAKVVAAAVKRGAPKDTGLLIKSVKVRAGKRKKDNIRMRVVVTGGHGRNMVAPTEYGDKDQAPNPFMRTAFSETKDPVLSDMIGDVKAAIEAAGK
jgi:HK97 gp10 family phage protein